jgi:hypothetical protein
VRSAPPFDLIVVPSLLNYIPFEFIDLSDHEIMEIQLTFEQKDVPSPTGRALDEISKRLAEIVRKWDDMVFLIADLILGWIRSSDNGC